MYLTCHAGLRAPLVWFLTLLLYTCSAVGSQLPATEASFRLAVACLSLLSKQTGIKHRVGFRDAGLIAASMATFATKASHLSCVRLS